MKRRNLSITERELLLLPLIWKRRKESRVRAVHRFRISFTDSFCFGKDRLTQRQVTVLPVEEKTHSSQLLRRQ